MTRGQEGARRRAPSKKGMEARVVCATCGAAGFLADKVSLFPFALGGLLGAVLTASLPNAQALLLARLRPRRAPSECSTAASSQASEAYDSDKED
jgi:hypothetical protein